MLGRIVFVLLVALVIVCPTAFGRQLVCDRPHEEPGCGSACQETCATMNQPCLIKNIRCTDACYCEDGFVRDCRGRCIPKTSCPGKGCR